MDTTPTGSVLRNINCVLDNPAQLRAPERLLMYTLVVAFKPRCALEIGSAEGGSALLTCAAMDDNGFGRMVCVDPQFRFADSVWERIRHRVTRVQGFSPQVLNQAALAVEPERFDFAFIDGDHTFDGVQRDIQGVLPLLADQAVLLFHDSHHPPVRAGIDDIMARCSGELNDLGELSAEHTTLATADGTEIWGGIRAARFVRGRKANTATADDTPLDENTRLAMNTIIRRSTEKITELEHANAAVWAELQSMRAGFDERGTRVRELEERFGSLWQEFQTATGNYERELARLLREQSTLAAGFEERGRRVLELEASSQKLWDELSRLSIEFDARGRRIRELEQARGRSGAPTSTGR